MTASSVEMQIALRSEEGSAELHTRAVIMQGVVGSEKRFAGLDAHAERTTVAIAAKDRGIHTIGVLSNRPESVK